MASAQSVPVTGPIGPKRYSFAGIPGNTGQRNWRYAFIPGANEGEGEIRMSSGKGRETMRWKILGKDPKNPEANPSLERLPDLDLPDQAADKKGKTGIFQVHRTSGDEIYGTIQDGKSNASLRFNRTGAKWDLEVLPPTKSKGESAIGFISALSQRKVASTTAIDTLTYPLTSDNALPGIAIAGGIGVLGGLGYKAFNKLKQGLGLSPRPRYEEDEPGWLDMAGKGLLAGAGASALFRGVNGVMGGRKPNQGPTPIDGLSRKWTTMPDGSPTQIIKGLPPGFDPDVLKTAFLKTANGLDYRDVISAIKKEESMSEQEKSSLIAQARDASHKGIDIDQQALVGAGLGALAAFIFSRMVGMGSFGTAAMTTFGALAGGAIAKPNENIDRHRGGYTVKPFQ